jgi:Zn-dependent protease
MNCEKCGQETFLPFQCPYCGGQFCAAHRLPENHDCAKMDRARASKQDEAVVLKAPSSYEYTVSFGQPRRMKGRVYFSPKELKHLAGAGLLVIGIGLSSVIYSSSLALGNLAVGLPIFAAILTVSFFAHEMAHKFTAQRRGLWAEFRLTLWGSILTLISIISPLFKIISPGAVMISGSAGIREMGKISLAGPVTNISLSAGFLSLAFFAPGDIAWVFFLSALLNGFMAVFNLIPFGIFDGFKIFSWDKKVWAVAFGISLALTISAYVLSGFSF